MILKYFTIVLTYSFFAAAKVEHHPDLRASIDQFRATCLAKLGLTQADYDAFSFDDKNEKVMCYARCFFIEAKWINEDEVLDVEYVKETIHDSIRHVTLPELENCSKKMVGEKCGKTFNFVVCMHDAEPEAWDFH